MSIRITILRPGDEQFLSSVATCVFDDPINAEATSEFLADPRHIMAVALDDGAVVGFASAVVYVHPDKPTPELWINEVGVAPSHRRRGVARELLDSLFNAGAEAGCAEAWVLTERSNEPAMRLYASTGGEATEDVVMFTFALDQAPHGQSDGPG